MHSETDSETRSETNTEMTIETETEADLPHECEELRLLLPRSRYCCLLLPFIILITILNRSKKKFDAMT